MQPDWLDFSFFLCLLVLQIYIVSVNHITPLHKTYLAFHSLMMLWPLCLFFLHIVPDQKIQWFLLNIAFVGLCFMGFGWLTFALALTRKINSLKRKTIYLAAVPAFICSVLVTTNPWHFLFTKPVNGGWTVHTYGPFFWVFVLSSMIYLMVAIILMVRTMSIVHDGNMKKQISLCLVGVLLLIMFSLLDVLFNNVLYPRFGIVPGLTSLGIFISVICFAIAIQKYDLLRIINIAQIDVINSMSTGMIVVDKDEVVRDLNNSAAKILPFQAGEIFDFKRFYDFSKAEGLTGKFLAEYAVCKLKNLQAELTLRGEQTWHVAINVAPVLDRKKIFLGRVITINDISELQGLVEKINEKNIMLSRQNQELLRIQEELSGANEKLEEMTITDVLTGCYNKRYLQQRLVNEMAVAHHYNNNLSIMLLDLDNFKLINDTYGHLSGDELLRGIVEVVQKNLRQTDILARFGGEEFVIYVPFTSKATAMVLAERIRLAVQDHTYGTIAGNLTATISIGLVNVETEIFRHSEKIGKEFLEQILLQADEALYQAKAKGRNCVVVAQ